MEIPALRQPKIIQKGRLSVPKLPKEDVQNVILKLKGDRSLVISSDAYHGIIKGRAMFRCVFCRAEMEPDAKVKEAHKVSNKHRLIVESYPHIEDFAENLIRKLDKDTLYCTLCNVLLSTPFLVRHMSAESHRLELQRAEMRASVYEPSNKTAGSVNIC